VLDSCPAAVWVPLAGEQHLKGVEGMHFDEPARRDPL
jgi:hypothetical protein